MEGSSVLSCSNSSSSCPSSSSCAFIFQPLSSSSLVKSLSFSSKRQMSLAVSSIPFRTSIRTSAFVVEKSPHTHQDIMPKIDKSGRFCSPRAARELALLTIYAACLEGSDPIRLFERKMNVRRESGYEFDNTSLMNYNHMSFGGPPVTVETVEEADELFRSDEKESAVEAEVLSAPPKMVYSKLILRFTRKLLVAVVDKWDSHVLVIDKVSPPNWKNVPAGRILEFCILHLAMSEISVLETRHQIVINEAVDLAKRFCDGSAPRIINGCLRTFVKDLSVSSTAYATEPNGQVLRQKIIGVSSGQSVKSPSENRP
ncbi:antitermination NusB domain-containing protein [Euphorbia peplus]|nr:antitermination NusB domain-containing protein [Euphorbia peplus]